MKTQINWLRSVSIGIALLSCFSAGAEVVTVYRTNFTSRVITNTIEVRVPTNTFVNEYRTNWIQQVATNVVDVFITNRVTVTRTNLNTITVTNQEALSDSTKPRDTRPEPAGATSSLATSTDTLLLDAAKTTDAKGNEVVQLTVKWSRDASASVPVRQWRVEREDGAILSFGQDRTFTKDLPAGKYQVELRVQRDENSPVLVARGTLTVAGNRATLQQTPLPSR